MISIEKEDWGELVRILKETEDGLANLNGGDRTKEMEQFRQSLQSFHTTAAMFGLVDLERAGLELQNFLSNQVGPAGNIDAITTFGFALSTLVEQMGGEAEPIDLNEILDILGLPATAENNEPPVEDLQPVSTLSESDQPPCSQEGEEVPGLPLLDNLVKNFGGKLTVAPDGASGGQFSITLTGPVDALKKLENLLCAADPACSLSLPAAPDARMEKMIAQGKKFMEVFSGGDLEHAQEILLSLAEPQDQTGLFKEIGGMARGLHDSICSFLSNLDPAFKEMVEDKIPDTGNRLEHMMELTEKAAITTLDHVEAIQERLVRERKQIAGLREIFGGLSAIGDGAAKKIEEGSAILAGMDNIIALHREDLDVILSAQDYQDLSGQIILKISKLLKDMELKLVNLIRTFGVKPDSKQKSKEDEMYGPAHQGREESVHSQDEVDSLLAEFGF